MPLPTARLALVTALTAPAWTLSNAAGLIVTAALALVVVVDQFRTVSPSELDVTRSVPRALPLGGSGELAWTISSRASRASTVSVADTLAPSLGAPARRFTIEVPAGGGARAATRFAPRRRGAFTLGPVVVRVASPLALSARQEGRSLDGEIRVLPPFRSRAEASRRLDKARVLEVGLRSAKARGGGTDFDQLRDYTADDEFRRIDWAATARTNHPVVRTYRAEQNQTVLCLLDAGRAMAGTVGGVPRIEHAMDAVMMLTVIAGRLGDRVGLVAFDRDVVVHVPPSSHRRQVSRITDAMFDLEPQLVESDLRGAVAAALGRSSRRMAVVIFTELRPAVLSDTLLPALAALRHHEVIIAAVSDPVIEGWVTGPATVRPDAFRRAAAADAQLQRRRAVALLRSSGVTVIDAPPGKLATGVADAYLEMKATGAL